VGVAPMPAKSGRRALSPQPAAQSATTTGMRAHPARACRGRMYALIPRRRAHGDTHQDPRRRIVREARLCVLCRGCRLAIGQRQGSAPRFRRRCSRNSRPSRGR
jgi:hypothetical protein